MGRGLGAQQRAVLAALRTLDRKRGQGWHMPADVIAILAPAWPTPVPVVPAESPERAALTWDRHGLAVGEANAAHGTRLPAAALGSGWTVSGTRPASYY